MNVDADALTGSRYFAQIRGPAMSCLLFYHVPLELPGVIRPI